MKTIHVTGIGNDPVSKTKAQMRFEVEAEDKEDLVKQVLKGYSELSNLIYMVNIPLHNFNEE